MVQVENFYDEDAAVYDEKRFNGFSGKYEARLHQRYLSHFLKHVPDGSKILEIGPGTGRFSLPMLDQGYDLTTLDISIEMLEEVNMKLESDGASKKMQLVQGDATTLPFNDESFEGCLVVNVTSHLPDAESVIDQISTSLSKGGFLLINFPNLSSIYYPVGKYVNYKGKSVQEDVYSRWYSYPEMTHLLESNGFEIESKFSHMITPRRELPILNKAIVHADDLSSDKFMKSIAGYVFFVAKKR